MINPNSGRPVNENRAQQPVVVPSYGQQVVPRPDVVRNIVVPRPNNLQNHHVVVVQQPNHVNVQVTGQYLLTLEKSLRNSQDQLDIQQNSLENSVISLVELANAQLETVTNLHSQAISLVNQTEHLPLQQKISARAILERAVLQLERAERLVLREEQKQQRLHAFQGINLNVPLSQQGPFNPHQMQQVRVPQPGQQFGVPLANQPTQNQQQRQPLSRQGQGGLF